MCKEEEDDIYKELEDQLRELFEEDGAEEGLDEDIVTHEEMWELLDLGELPETYVELSIPGHEEDTAVQMIVPATHFKLDVDYGKYHIYDKDGMVASYDVSMVLAIHYRERGDMDE